MQPAPESPYVVLARKYRPQTFSDLIGQEPVVRTLRNAMALGRVHHAFVLAGARGVGKTTTARLLAKSLNCEQGITIDPCRQCASCTSIAAGVAPQVLEIDGASNTGVDSVRELREAARYKPALGRYKIYIVDEVHMLSQAAFNALLKLLEEPPPHVKFIFATTEPHKIPVTILSRCQRFDFRRVAGPTLFAHLQKVAEAEGVRITPGAVGMLVRDAEGSVRDALSLFDQAIGFAGEAPVDEAALAAMGSIDRHVPRSLLAAVLARDAGVLLEQVHQVDLAGHDWAEVMRLFLLHVRDVALACATQGKAPFAELTPDEQEALAAEASARGEEDWQRLFEKASLVADAVGRSPVPKATFEMGLLRLMQIAPAADVGRLLAQIDTWMAQTPATRLPERAAQTSVAPAPVATSAVASPPQATRASELRDGHAAAADDAGVHGAWRRYVQAIGHRRPALASLLEQGQVVAWRPNEAVVAVAAGTFAWQTLRETKNRSLLDEVLSDHLGAPTTLTLVPSDASVVAAPSLAEQRSRARADHQRRAEEAAKAHPSVQAAASVLGAKIESVKPWTSANPQEDDGAAAAAPDGQGRGDEKEDPTP